jgi:hypothetical protein
MAEIIEKSRILYKGDMIAAMFYIMTGMILFVFAAVLYYFNISLGFQYLSIGFFMFFIYSTGKGLLMYHISRKRWLFYEKMHDLDPTAKKEELEYTNFRIEKKQTNRRIYVYALVFFCVAAFAGIFSIHKAIIMGTSIPIALVSGIEFSVGMLTEFRLREYCRILMKG